MAALKTCIITKVEAAPDIVEDLASFPHQWFVTCKTIPHSFMLVRLSLEIRRKFLIHAHYKISSSCRRGRHKRKCSHIKEMLFVG